MDEVRIFGVRTRFRNRDHRWCSREARVPCWTLFQHDHQVCPLNRRVLAQGQGHEPNYAAGGATGLVSPDFPNCLLTCVTGPATIHAGRPRATTSAIFLDHAWSQRDIPPSEHRETPSGIPLPVSARTHDRIEWDAIARRTTLPGSASDAAVLASGAFLSINWAQP